MAYKSLYSSFALAIHILAHKVLDGDCVSEDGALRRSQSVSCIRTDVMRRALFSAMHIPVV